MNRKTMILVLMSILVLLVGVVVLVPMEDSIIWSGSFAQAEYQLLFKDQNDGPIMGIQLYVKDDQSSLSYYYPVTDYYPGNLPLSDKNGLLVFHHVQLGMEYGGKCGKRFWVFPVQGNNCRAPIYYCHFFYNGVEIHSIKYNALNREFLDEVDRINDWDHYPRVRRSFR